MQSSRRTGLGMLLSLLLLAGVAGGCGGDDPKPQDGASGPFGPNSFDTAAPDAAIDAPDAAPAAEVPDDAPLVVFLGDSLAAGLHLSADQAFPAVAHRILLDEGAPFRLVNAGISGDTSSGGVARLDWMLKQEPDVLVVELGANDGLRGMPTAELAKNLREICERTLASGTRVLLLGLRLPPSYGEYAAEFDAVYGAIAEDLDVDYVPYFMEGVGGVPEMNLDDGLHPRPEGHAKLAENIAPALRELVLEVGAQSDS